MTLPFNIADVNINERDWFMATPTLKSKGMQEKESIMVVWCVSTNPPLGITVWHHLAKPRDAKQ